MKYKQQRKLWLGLALITASTTAFAFDEACYLARYPDVVAGWTNKGGKAIDHWNKYGKYENRNPDCDPVVAPKPTTPAVDPMVFNEACYLARYPDVVQHWTNNGGKAIDHWNKNGKFENRIPGCDAVVVAPPVTTPTPTPTPPVTTPVVVTPVPDSTVFNEACYLERYPDIVAYWVMNGGKAVDHYTRAGKAEGRIAGCTSTSSPQSQPITATTSISGTDANPITITIDNNKFAGAVSSLTWKGKEFININDHGRQLQSALQMDGYGECNNPTEAGSAADGDKNSSSSKILSVIKNSPSNMTTRSQMAFWSAGRLTAACPRGMDSRVDAKISRHTMEKTINIGEFNDPSIIGYSLKFKHPGDGASVSIIYEFLTGYMTTEFSKYYYMNKSTDELVPYADKDMVSIEDQGFGPGSSIGRPANKREFDPVIVATADENYAMGIYVPEASIKNCNSFFHGYGMYRFTGTGGAHGYGTNKWSLALEDNIKSNCIVNNERKFKVYMAVGSVATVKQKLIDIMKKVD